MDSAEITEMMAFEGLEPFGALPDEFRLGQVAAVVANVNRDARTTPDPFTAADFMPALRAAFPAADPESKFLADPEAQSALFDLMIFGRAGE